MRVWIGSKLILGLDIVAAKTLARYYVDVLWLNIITLAVVAVLAVVLDFKLLGSIYGVAVGKVFGKK